MIIVTSERGCICSQLKEDFVSISLQGRGHSKVLYAWNGRFYSPKDLGWRKLASYPMVRRIQGMYLLIYACKGLPSINIWHRCAANCS